ncbi:cell envelope integrity protein TolA [Marilutibacter alkalisoli]|uniref:Cell envelope integrity protein TolA n=1 Tax=Marilutibacter alkalisoli TaxID=2591633 RepID=A0A514BU44_9GAMM|nr:cell envelope integrity protein TolA [Lysobacter alkalisoli]QDH70896.1 cell envelope integrity protein TolA [Lysobacter alkalisoli]
MRETRADTALAVVLAVGLHLLLILLLLSGLWWTRSNPQVLAMGSPISAELVDANELSQAMQQTLAERPDPVELPEPEVVVPDVEETVPPPQPLPTPVPEDAPDTPQPQPQDFLPEPDVIEQDEVTDLPTPTPADEERERQEERRRQEQIDLTERQRQEEAERKRRLAEQQAEAEREARLAEIRRQREAAQREARQAEERLKQIADAQARTASSGAASAPAGQGGTDTDLRARYQAALTQAILSKWTRPETVPIGARCRLVIRQLPGGEVMSAEVSSPCAYDEQGRRSIEAAVLKAQPLPYAGFESVFARELILNFEARDR